MLDAFAHILKDKASPAQVPDFIRGDESQVMAALTVYRNNVQSSLSRVLADIFPVLHALVGEDFFKFLAHEYYQAHPPMSRMVVRYGDHMATFLAGFKPAASYPYLPDIARLEIAYLTAYHAGDADLAKPETILAAAGQDIADLKFSFHPSVQFMTSDFPVASIWQAHKDGTPESLGKDLQNGEHILIARSHNQVTIRVLTRGDFAALKALSLEQTLEGAVSSGADADDRFDPQSFFQTLFQLEIIAGFQQAGS